MSDDDDRQAYDRQAFVAGAAAMAKMALQTPLSERQAFLVKHSNEQTLWKLLRGRPASAGQLEVTARAGKTASVVSPGEPFDPGDAYFVPCPACAAKLLEEDPGMPRMGGVHYATVVGFVVACVAGCPDCEPRFRERVDDLAIDLWFKRPGGINHPGVKGA